MKFDVPACCGLCKYRRKKYGIDICISPLLPKELDALDVSTFRVDPFRRPEWCPYNKTDQVIDSLSEEKRAELDQLYGTFGVLLGWSIKKE